MFMGVEISYYISKRTTILWYSVTGTSGGGGWGRQTVILQNETDILSQCRLMTWKSCPYSVREFGVCWSLECAHKCTHFCAWVRASAVNRLGFTMPATDGCVVECMWRNRAIRWRLGSVIWCPCWVASVFPTSPVSQTVETSGWFDWNKHVVLKGGWWIVSHFWKHCWRVKMNCFKTVHSEYGTTLRPGLFHLTPSSSFILVFYIPVPRVIRGSATKYSLSEISHNASRNLQTTVKPHIHHFHDCKNKKKIIKHTLLMGWSMLVKWLMAPPLTTELCISASICWVKSNPWNQQIIIS